MSPASTWAPAQVGALGQVALRGAWLIFAVVSLAGCDSAANPPAQPTVQPAMQGAALPLPASAPSGPLAWRDLPDAAAFGPVAGAPLLSVRCLEEDGRRFVEIVRHTPSEPGAKALLALIGNRQIARLPVDAAAGQEGARWVGRFEAADSRLDIFLGGGEIAATLPGGGRIVLDASAAPGAVVGRCRALGPELAM